MLYLIPAWLHRRLMPAAHRLRTLWLRFARPTIHGVSVMAFDEENRLLLVRHSYGTPKWAMPAGGRRASEDPEVAIRREVREELGVDLESLSLVVHREEDLRGGTNHVHVFTARVRQEPRPDLREVVAAQFFALDDLPDRLEKRVRPRLDLLKDLE